MSELTLLRRAVWLRVRLAFRVMVSAIALFACLLVVETVVNSPSFPQLEWLSRSGIHSVPQFVSALIVVWLYVAIVNSVFRTTGRRTVYRRLDRSSQTTLLMFFIYGPFVPAFIVARFAVADERIYFTALASLLASVPVLIWVIFCPGVAQVMSDHDREAEKRRKQRRKTNSRRLDSQVAQLRRAYQQKRRHIDSLPIAKEERDTLKELAEGAFRDRMHDLLADNSTDSFDIDQMFQD